MGFEAKCMLPVTHGIEAIILQRFLSANTSRYDNGFLSLQFMLFTRVYNTVCNKKK